MIIDDDYSLSNRLCQVVSLSDRLCLVVSPRVHTDRQMGVDFPRDDLEGFFELLLPDEKTRGFAEVLDRLPASIFIVNDFRRLMTEKGARRDSRSHGERRTKRRRGI